MACTNKVYIEKQWLKKQQVFNAGYFLIREAPSVVTMLWGFSVEDFATAVERFR